MSRRAAAAGVVVWAGCLGGGCTKASDSVVVVDVQADANVTGVVQLRATVSNAEASDVRMFPLAAATQPLAFPTAFSLSFPSARQGTLDVALDGLGTGGTVVANGAERVVIPSGAHTNVTIALHAGASSCGNGRVDTGEQCDDGDRISAGSCDFRCQLRGGGDGGAGDGGDAGRDTGAPVCRVELLANGAFDQGPVVWTQSAMPSGNPLIYLQQNRVIVDQGVAADSPDFLAMMGQLDNEDQIVSQPIQIPANAMALEASGTIRVITMEGDGMLFDKAHLEIVQGTTVIALQDWSNNDHGDSWVRFSPRISAAPFRGMAMTFRLHVTTDDGVPTYFFFDTLSFAALLCPSADGGP